MGRPLKNIRWTAALAVQAGSRLLLDINSHSDEEHNLSPSQRAALLAISVGLVMMAGLMSGLTLGLMSMDLVELEVLKRSGTTTEQMYASAITPIVSNQHFLLVTLLLCNAVAMEALPLFLDRLADPVTAILISVSAVLIFGEILPQAVCSRYGLAIGYYCAWLVRGLMALTSPISWPIGKLLDFLLGAEHRALFRRGQLKALVDIHGASEGLGGNLSEDEIKVICGALDLTNKTARKSMTPLNKVFMLPADARLNRTTMRSILASGHSRIPVYAGGDRSNVIGLILVKELLQYKTHQEVPVSDVRMRSLPRLPADTPMYDMLKLFQTGRSHMVVLTDTPATARAAAAAEAAAAAAKAAAEAAEEVSSEQEEDSPTRLGSMLRGGKKRKERHQFHSPLLQPIHSEDQQAISRVNGGTPARGGAWMAGDEPQQILGNNAADTLYSALYAEQQTAEPPEYTEPSQRSSLAGAPASSVNGSSNPSAQLPREQELVPGSSSFAFASPTGAGGSRHPGSHSVVSGDAVAPVQGAVQYDSNPLDNSSQPSQQHHDASTMSAMGMDGVEEVQNSRGSLHARSMSGPLPTCANPLLMGGLSTPENGPEGVAMPIGIITIEDVIEELMQAEIVDETDLFIDNERSVAVNAAELARSLPAQLRLALAPAPSRGVSPAVGAAAARVTVRKLIKQKSSGALAAIAAGATNTSSSAAAAATMSSASGGLPPAGGAGSGAGVLQRGRPISDQGAVNPGLLQRYRASSDQGVVAQSSGSGGVVGAVSASLAAAAAAVTGAGGKGRAGDRQPLLPRDDRSAPAG